MLHTTRWTSRLLGIDCPEVSDLGYYDRTVLFLADGDLGEVINLRYRLQLPGYLDVDETIEARRAVRCLPRHRIDIHQSCGGFGRLAVVLSPPGRAEALSGPTAPGRQCRLILKSLATGRRFEFTLDELGPAGMQVVGGIPFGGYAVKFKGPHSLFEYPDRYGAPIFVKISAEPSSIEVVIPPTGTLSLQVRMADGSRYGGPLMGSHVRLDTHQMDVFYFSSPPYETPLMTGGEYRVSLDNMPALPESQIVLVDEADSTSTVSWQLR